MITLILFFNFDIPVFLLFMFRWHVHTYSAITWLFMPTEVCMEIIAFSLLVERSPN